MDLPSLFPSLTIDATASPPETQARDDLDNFLGLPILPIKIHRTASDDNENNTDTKPEIIGDTLVYPKAKLIATLITSEQVTRRNDPFYLIQDYINFSQPQNFGVKILKICKLTRYSETQDWSYQNVTTNSNRMMLWHGTKMDRVRSILENGFLKSSAPGLRKFGEGFYFADRVAKSSYYCSSRAYVCKPNEGEIGYLFLCEVQMGRTFETRSTSQQFFEPPQQLQMVPVLEKEDGKKNVTFKEEMVAFDSVKYMGNLKPDLKGEREVNGTIWPLGVTIREDDEVESKESAELAKGALKSLKVNYNEYIVYDQSKIKMKYLVKVEFTKEPVFNM